MKKKGHASEADVASSVDIKVLMTSYVEDTISQGKGWIFGWDIFPKGAVQ